MPTSEPGHRFHIATMQPAFVALPLRHLISGHLLSAAQGKTLIPVSA
jgi:hypothetical protein